MKYSTPRLPLLLSLSLTLLFALGCSVQEVALIKVAFVQGQISVPADKRAITIRVNRVGTTRNRVPVTAETTFCDVEGDFLLKTNKIGGGFVVARGIEFDIGYQEIFLEEYGERISVDRLLPETTPSLVAKTPGEALFLAFEEDWEPTFGDIETVALVTGSSSTLEGAISLHDDGSMFDIDHETDGVQVSGDVAPGDGVWTVRTTLPTGQQRYGFIFNRDLDRGVQRDPYEESSSGSRSQILVK